MIRKTLLAAATACALLGTAAVVAQQAPSRLDRNNDGVVDKAEAAQHPRLAQRFDQLDTNKDGKLQPVEWQGGHRGPGMMGGAGDGQRGFMRLDTNKDGRISQTEAAADPRVGSRFASMDVNKDGFLDKADMDAMRSQRAQQRFAELDANRDGRVTRDEMQAAHAKRMAEMQQRRAQRFEEHFKRMDANGDGTISQDEFAKGGFQMHHRGGDKHHGMGWGRGKGGPDTARGQGMPPTKP